MNFSLLTSCMENSFLRPQNPSHMTIFSKSYCQYFPSVFFSPGQAFCKCFHVKVAYATFVRQVYTFKNQFLSFILQLLAIRIDPFHALAKIKLLDFSCNGLTKKRNTNIGLIAALERFSIKVECAQS